nr:MAG TPA: Golgi reassembly-stacking protein 1, Golgin fold six-stranded anti parallel-barrel.96A [Caudoviricetes sp.]
MKSPPCCGFFYACNSSRTARAHITPNHTL